MRVRTVQLVARNSSAQAELTFQEEELGGKQARLHQRLALRPILDIKGYRCRAVIDWIDLVFHTDHKTQWIWVQDEIGKAIGQKCRVWGRRSGDSGDYHDFNVRFQEPDYDKLRLAERAMQVRWGLRYAPQIQNLEISVDFRPRSPSEESLNQMFGALVRAHLPGRDVISQTRDRPRFSWGEGSANTLHVLRYSASKTGNDQRLISVEGDEAVPLDATCYTGARGSRSAWRIMTKVLDRQNRSTGGRVHLPENERRVRIEVTLNREELEEVGLVTLEDLGSFRFQTLQGRYFQFWLPTFKKVAGSNDPHAAMRAALEEERIKKFLNAGVLGLQAMDEARARIIAGRRTELRRTLGRPLKQTSRRGRGKSSTLVAFDELSRPVKYALRHLGERLGSGR